MVEVFKTNVRARRHARLILDQIHQNFQDYHANFDLEDCDNILRVECRGSFIQPSLLIQLLAAAGFRAEVLADEA
ncbi:hypothetical protein [Hymenobacter sublimis]|uniref:Uncharacterized protein n=1 Tax=Hymenobacter sublimis TaxID=2933777 RepID=A0ABY4JBL5_9BACT|nr:hypothetical protein [Hymenobacter sublimis]UPL49249.1 hypothetical protein MWH26_18985 [Hymenobacter sublimis]